LLFLVHRLAQCSRLSFHHPGISAVPELRLPLSWASRLPLRRSMPWQEHRRRPSDRHLGEARQGLDAEPAELLGKVQVADDWIDELASVAATIPKQLRPVAFAVMKAMA
jgi:hypothetical protein